MVPGRENFHSTRLVHDNGHEIRAVNETDCCLYINRANKLSRMISGAQRNWDAHSGDFSLLSFSFLIERRLPILFHRHGSPHFSENHPKVTSILSTWV